MKLNQRLEKVTARAQDALIARIRAMPVDDLVMFLREHMLDEYRLTPAQDAAVTARTRGMGAEDALAVFRGVYAGWPRSERVSHMARMLPRRAAEPERWARMMAMIWPEGQGAEDERRE